MPVSSPRYKLLPLRGTYNALLANIAEIADGEICYALDQDQHYQNEGGTLVAVAASKAQGALADTAIQPGDNVSELTNDANYFTANVSSPQADDLLQFNGAEWVNTAAPAADISGNSIGDLQDVDIATTPPQNGFGLFYNGSAWTGEPVATLDQVRLDAESKTFSYTNGDLTAVTGAEVQLAITYNQDGTVNTVAKTVNGTTVTKTLGYDQSGNLTSITVS